MAAISRRGQGGRIYNNTRARVLLRRMCVKLADLTAHSQPKTFARPRTATRPRRALPLPHAAPTHARRLRNAFPTDLTTHSPPKTSARPSTATRPSRALPLPHAMPTPAHAVPTHARRLRDARPPTSQPTPRRRPPLAPAAPTHARRLRDARPPTSPPIPRRRPPLAPAQRHALAEHFRPPRSADARPRSPEPRPQAARSIPRSDTLPLLPFRFGHKKNGTAQCMCDAECLGRPSLRSVIWVGEPRAVRRRCGALACRRGA